MPFAISRYANWLASSCEGLSSVYPVAAGGRYNSDESWKGSVFWVSGLTQWACWRMCRKHIWGIHRFAENSGCLFWCHFAATKSNPSVNRAGGHFQHAEWQHATSISENTHRNTETSVLGPEKWYPGKESLLGHCLVGGLGIKHGLFSTSEGVLFGVDGENWIIF